MFVQYVGPSDVRTITADDWKTVDEGRGGPVENDTVTWDDDNLFIAEVTDAAGEWLVRYDPEFKVAPPAAVEEQLEEEAEEILEEEEAAAEEAEA